MLLLKVHIHILRRPHNFVKSSPYFWLALHRTKVRWRFHKIVGPSQNIWTLIVGGLKVKNNCWRHLWMTSGDRWLPYSPSAGTNDSILWVRMVTGWNYYLLTLVNSQINQNNLHQNFKYVINDFQRFCICNQYVLQYFLSIVPNRGLICMGAMAALVPIILRNVRKIIRDMEKLYYQSAAAT